MAHWTLLIAGAALLVLLIVLLGGANRDNRLPPGPPPLPVLGNLLLLCTGTSPQRSLSRLSKRYGPLIYLRLGSMPAVVVSNASLAKEFLTSCDKVFASRPDLQIARRLQYGEDSILSLSCYGSYWRDMRKICALQLFSATRVSEFEPVRMEEIKLMIKDLVDQAQRGTHLVDVRMCIANLTENIMGRILFSKRLSEVTGAQLGRSLGDVIREAAALFRTPVVGDFVPYLGWLDGKAKRSMDEAHKAFDDLLETVLNGRSKSDPGADDQIDFLDVLLSNNFTKNKLKALLQDLIGAGTHTTIVTLEWALAELLRSPDIMQKLQQEIDTVVGRHRMVEESDLIDLFYLKAVVKETLRLYPPAPLLIPHMSMEACTVAGYTLPKETRLFVNVWAIGRDPEMWEEPEKFMPERFVGQDMDVRGQHFQLLPFGAGRRSCPGLPLAMITLEVTLANLAHCFDWELPRGPHDVDMWEISELTMTLANRLLAIPKPRLDDGL